MSTYQEQQELLIRKIEAEYKKGKDLNLSIIRKNKDFALDDRMCLTSVVFPPKHILDRIEERIFKPLREADPTQFYYPRESMHLTFQSIQNIAKPPTFNEEDIVKVSEILARVVPKCKRFKYVLKGIFELPTSICVCAFIPEEIVPFLKEIRAELIKIGLPDNKVYASDSILFSNISCIRFNETPNEAFQKKKEELNWIEIGEFEATHVTLIASNGVCHPDKTTKFKEFYLGS
eukprot:TRINITY_DN7659_c0_g1_i1.p1 TRINITY_DN7659_c0_g1~~TRINITY_DN7659_c0_g1_i1.p1  ORF type:complete len:233 (-),score=37.05 TRINITY_DN7659_c0_g1_i1:111-809(-)